MLLLGKRRRRSFYEPEEEEVKETDTPLLQDYDIPGERAQQ